MSDEIQDQDTGSAPGPNVRAFPRLKVTSGGTLFRSEAIDLETGDKIPFREARITITADRGVEIELLACASIEIEGRGVVRAICPACEQQRDMVVRVQKPDGTVAAWRPGMPKAMPDDRHPGPLERFSVGEPIAAAKLNAVVDAVNSLTGREPAYDGLFPQGGVLAQQTVRGQGGQVAVKGPA